MEFLSFPLFLAKKGNYFSVVATFGGSLLSGGRYFRNFTVCRGDGNFKLCEYLGSYGYFI